MAAVRVNPGLGEHCLLGAYRRPVAIDWTI
jgi:hypothetical protein